MAFASPTPLVSVIISCFNYGRFLEKAIDSAKQQTHPAIEIIVVDDGSTDNTREVVARHPDILYVYQKNQGPSAARNLGIDCSTGEYIVFLDADDWFFPEALAVNLAILQQAPEVAMCYGAYTAVYEDGQQRNIYPPLTDHPYRDLIAKGNYIAMIAAIMFPRWVLISFRFDVSLPNCEDYDLYLRIAQHHPVHQHQLPLAAYRIHKKALSASIPDMLAGALHVLKRPETALPSGLEDAHKQGIHFWKTYYKTEFREGLVTNRPLAYWTAMSFFLKYAPFDGLKYSVARMKSVTKALLKSMLPAPVVRGLRRLKPIKYATPPVGSVQAGDFQRTTPFCNEFGYSRGGPIDRYYIERFLADEATSIRGRVLEIGDNSYTVQYSAGKVHTSDVLHVDATNESATFVGDLSHAPHLPDNAFDCIILTQTLHLIYDFRGALATCYRILKPGGTLLLTVPGLSPIDKGEWRDIWYWSFTNSALNRLMAEFFADAEVTLGSFGNVRVATAFLYGMGITELTEQELNYYDPQFQVINTLKAVKGGAHA